MFENHLKLIRKLVPPDFMDVAYIAGGAAIAPQSSDDIDVFVLTEDFEALENHLDSLPIGTVYSMDIYSKRNECQPGMLLSAEECEAYREYLRETRGESEQQHRVIATILLDKTYRKVQIIAGGYTDVDDLLDSFDISTHRWAISLGDTTLGVKGAHATLPSQLPRVVKVHNAVTTGLRLAKLCYRYGHNILEHPDYEFLTEAAKKQGREAEFRARVPSNNYIRDDEVPF